MQASRIKPETRNRKNSKGKKKPKNIHELTKIIPRNIYNFWEDGHEEKKPLTYDQLIKICELFESAYCKLFIAPLDCEFNENNSLIYLYDRYMVRFSDNEVLINTDKIDDGFIEMGIPFSFGTQIFNLDLSFAKSHFSDKVKIILSKIVKKFYDDIRIFENIKRDFSYHGTADYLEEGDEEDNFFSKEDSEEFVAICKEYYCLVDKYSKMKLKGLKHHDNPTENRIVQIYKEVMSFNMAKIWEYDSQYYKDEDSLDLSSYFILTISGHEHLYTNRFFELKIEELLEMLNNYGPRSLFMPYSISLEGITPKSDFDLEVNRFRMYLSEICEIVNDTDYNIK